MIAGLTPSPDEEEERSLKNPGPSYSGHIVEECVIPKIEIPFCTEDCQSAHEKSITETFSTTFYQTCRCSSHCNNYVVHDLSSSDSTLRSVSCIDNNDANDDSDGVDEEETQMTINESDGNSVICLTDFIFSDSPGCSNNFKQRPPLNLKSFNNKSSDSNNSNLPSSKNSSTEIISNLNPVLSFLPKSSLGISSCKVSDKSIATEKQLDKTECEMSLDSVPRINSVTGNTQVLDPSNTFSNTNNAINVLESNYLTLSGGLECLNIVEDNSTKGSEIFCCDFFKKIETSEHSNNHLDLDLVRPSEMPCSKDDSGPSFLSATITTCSADTEVLKVVKSSSDCKIGNKSSSKSNHKTNVPNCFPL